MFRKIDASEEAPSKENVDLMRKCERRSRGTTYDFYSDSKFITVVYKYLYEPFNPNRVLRHPIINFQDLPALAGMLTVQFYRI